MKRAMAVLLLGLVMTGCGGGGELRDLKDSASRDDITFAELYRVMEEGWQVEARCHDFLNLSCVSDDYKAARTELWDTVAHRLAALIEEGDPGAVRGVYEETYPHRTAFDIRVHRRQAGEPLLALAAGPESDPQLLYLAGRTVLDGQYVMQDHVLGSGFLYRAWLGGHTRAARLLAESYAASGQAANAYLWALCCTSPCSRMRELRSYMSPLDAGTVLEIQEKAQDTYFVDWVASN